MIILLNGPLGIGKSTLAEALMESTPQCIMLDGDHLIAANPQPVDVLELLHATIVLLVAHYRRLGYLHFVINHLWTTAAEINELRERLAYLDGEFRCFLLTLPVEENLHRIERRASVRALDEREHDLRVVEEERKMLFGGADDNLGERFDVSASPAILVERLKACLGLP